MEVRRYQSFSDLVRGIRRRNRLSQRALAKALKVSPGYVGQWELRLSQPSAEIAIKLCRLFEIGDVEYVQRLAYASKAPEWLQESIIRYQSDPQKMSSLSETERRLVQVARTLKSAQVERLADRVEGWADALRTEAAEDEPQ